MDLVKIGSILISPFLKFFQIWVKEKEDFKKEKRKNLNEFTKNVARYSQIGFHIVTSNCGCSGGHDEITKEEMHFFMDYRSKLYFTLKEDNEYTREFIKKRYQF